MCTLSVARSADGAAIRVVMNRDERRLRLAGLPPALFERDGVRALWPTDQEAGGTWIAVNDAGLVLAVMNANPGTQPATRVTGVPSRGGIIPSLIAARDLDDLAARCRKAGREALSCAPFILVAASLEGVGAWRPGAGLIAGGDLFTTSSLGDDLVAGPRRELFDHLLATSADAWTAQDRLHQHAWPDRRHLSVMMSRIDACTVSRTEVVVSAGRAEMRHTVLIDGWPAGVSAAAPSLAVRPESVAA